ncbi:MAG: ABC transporter ATP-binding protein [Planctomycetes bacterium]|nr:ABC transporter ATP-binding protein [Planctomycetota bacterium]
MTPDHPALAIENLVKTYHDGEGRLSVLNGVHFTVSAGESVAIVGRSGSGKSTILNLAGLLDRADAGEIRIGGVATSGLSEGRRTALRGRAIGFVFQNYHMLADFSILENVMLGAAVGRGGGFGRANRARAEEWLDRVGLAERRRHRPGQLSGGEQQRAAIARALMPEPQLLLCDEPTGNLDAATGEEVARWLWRVSGDAGMALVIVTHETALARRAGRVLRLENGVLAAATSASSPERVSHGQI